MNFNRRGRDPYNPAFYSDQGNYYDHGPQTQYSQNPYPGHPTYTRAQQPPGYPQGGGDPMSELQREMMQRGVSNYR